MSGRRDSEPAEDAARIHCQNLGVPEHLMAQFLSNQNNNQNNTNSNNNSNNNNRSHLDRAAVGAAAAAAAASQPLGNASIFGQPQQHTVFLHPQDLVALQQQLSAAQSQQMLAAAYQQESQYRDLFGAQLRESQLREVQQLRDAQFRDAQLREVQQLRDAQLRDAQYLQQLAQLQEGKPVMVLIPPSVPQNLQPRQPEILDLTSIDDGEPEVVAMTGNIPTTIAVHVPVNKAEKRTSTAVASKPEEKEKKKPAALSQPKRVHITSPSKPAPAIILPRQPSRGTQSETTTTNRPEIAILPAKVSQNESTLKPSKQVPVKAKPTLAKDHRPATTVKHVSKAVVPSKQSVPKSKSSAPAPAPSKKSASWTHASSDHHDKSAEQAAVSRPSLTSKTENLKEEAQKIVESVARSLAASAQNAGGISNDMDNNHINKVGTTDDDSADRVAVVKQLLSKSITDQQISALAGELLMKPVPGQAQPGTSLLTQSLTLSPSQLRKLVVTIEATVRDRSACTIRERDKMIAKQKDVLEHLRKKLNETVALEKKNKKKYQAEIEDIRRQSERAMRAYMKATVHAFEKLQKERDEELMDDDESV